MASIVKLSRYFSLELRQLVGRFCQALALAGQFVEDLRPLFEAGAMLGERLMPELVKFLDGPAVSYGKGAIVGVAGEMEHGGACVHPMLGKPMRAAIGGGKAVIGSNVKVAV